MIGGIRELSSPNWQPIETAPKDGTWILVCEPDGTDEPFIDVVRWFDPMHYVIQTAPYWGGRDGGKSCDPEFWHPLPPPPVGSGQNLADAHSKNPPEADRHG